MSELAKRAVACRHWRWMPGMLAVHPNWRGYRVSHVGLTGMHGACRYASPMGGVSYAVAALPLPTSSDVLPDLTDPATLGCLLALVREAWGKAVSFRPRPCGLCGVVVTVGDIGHGDAEVRFSALTFVKALVAALEAAP